MRAREKLTLEEKVALALELIKRERTLDEIRAHYRVSHTTAYKVRNTFLEGGKAALVHDGHRRHKDDLERRVRALEDQVQTRLGALEAEPGRGDRPAKTNGIAGGRRR